MCLWPIGTGVVTTLAGTANTAGFTDATGTAAMFKNPWGIAVDTKKNVYVGDNGNDTVRKITHRCCHDPGWRRTQDRQHRRHRRRLPIR
jgi:hypothetical protein